MTTSLCVFLGDIYKEFACLLACMCVLLSYINLSRSHSFVCFILTGVLQKIGCKKTAGKRHALYRAGSLAFFHQMQFYFLSVIQWWIYLIRFFQQ